MACARGSSSPSVPKAWIELSPPLVTGTPGATALEPGVGCPSGTCWRGGLEGVEEGRCFGRGGWVSALVALCWAVVLAVVESPPPPQPGRAAGGRRAAREQRRRFISAVPVMLLPLLSALPPQHSGEDRPAVVLPQGFDRGQGWVGADVGGVLKQAPSAAVKGHREGVDRGVWEFV